MRSCTFSTSGWLMTMSVMSRTSWGSGGLPSSGLSVSFAALKPEKMMNTATAAPPQPSTFTSANRASSIEMRTTLVAMLSESESMAVADMPGEFIFRPMPRLYANM